MIDDYLIQIIQEIEKSIRKIVRDIYSMFWAVKSNGGKEMAVCPNPECRNTRLMFTVDDLSHIECDKCGTKWSTYNNRKNIAESITVIEIVKGKYKGRYTSLQSIIRLLGV